MTECSCPQDVKTLLTAHINGEATCLVHAPSTDTQAGDPPALNSDRLTQILAAAVGGTVHEGASL